MRLTRRHAAIGLLVLAAGSAFAQDKYQIGRAHV